MSTQTTCKDCGETIAQVEDKALDGTHAVVWSSTESGWICERTGDEHVPVPPFTGVPGYEHDHAGRPMCGHDFMAGTICSDEREHDGPHSARCQGCGGDWINGTCTCERGSSTDDPDSDLWDDEDEVCRTCGEPYSGYGDGWDGECPSCADKTYEVEEALSPAEALDYAILNINTDLAPDATSALDKEWLEENAEKALVTLNRIREWVIAQGEDFVLDLDTHFPAQED